MSVCAAPIPASALLLLLHLLRLPVTHAVYTYTHRPGCVNSWEAGLCNEVAATTRALPPGEQSPERRGGAAGPAGATGVARRLGMLRAERAPAQVACPARAHAPRAGLGGRRRAPSRRPRAQREKPEKGAEEKFP